VRGEDILREAGLRTAPGSPETGQSRSDGTGRSFECHSLTCWLPAKVTGKGDGDGRQGGMQDGSHEVRLCRVAIAAARETRANKLDCSPARRVSLDLNDGHVDKRGNAHLGRDMSCDGGCVVALGCPTVE